MSSGLPKPSNCRASVCLRCSGSRRCGEVLVDMLYDDTGRDSVDMVVSLPTTAIVLLKLIIGTPLTAHKQALYQVAANETSTTTLNQNVLLYMAVIRLSFYTFPTTYNSLYIDVCALSYMPHTAYSSFVDSAQLTYLFGTNQTMTYSKQHIHP